MDHHLPQSAAAPAKKEYIILPTDTLELVPEALIITRANGQRIVLAIEHMPAIRMPEHCKNC
jgi:hypothetical protein